MAGKTIYSLVNEAFLELVYWHTMIAQVVMSCGGVEVVEKSPFNAMAWTDGKGIFLNKEYIKKYEETYGKFSTKHYMFLIAHEALHLMLLTLSRMDKRNRILWNMATDYAINSALINDEGIDAMPTNGLYNTRYSNWKAEDIYDDLLKYYENRFNVDNNLSTPSTKESANEDNRIQNGITNHKYNIDVHIDIDESTAESVQLKVEDIMRNHSAKSEKLYNRLLQLLPEVKFPWKEVLNKYIKGFIKSNASWKLPSRRGLAIGTYLPRIMKTPFINIAIAIDTSGSISQDNLNLFFSHLRKILHSFKDFNIELFCFSTEVHKNTLVKLNKILSKKFNFSDYNLESNGGTNIKSAFEYIENHRDDFDIFICMTDGQDNIRDLSFSKTNVIWVIIGDNKKIFTSPDNVKKAEVIFIDEDDK